MSLDPCRFCRVYALAAPVLAALMGAWTSLQAALDPSAAQKGHLVWASLVRATAPAASGSALLLALVLWAHPLALPALRTELSRVLKRAAVAAFPAYLVSAGLALLAGLAVATALGSLQVFAVSAGDFAVGAAFAVLDGVLVLALGWRLLPRLQQARLSLPAKLGLALAVTVPLRATVALVAASATG